MVFLKEFFEKIDFEKKTADDKKTFPRVQRVKQVAQVMEIGVIECSH